jgi:hypothetical protein
VPREEASLELEFEDSVMAEDTILSGTPVTTPPPQPPADDIERVVDGERTALGLVPGEQGNALCLSGGGIRSATFSLGVLQGLAKYKRLRDFHYLSTVSGGGYIGLWLSAWISRSEGDIGKVETELPGKPLDKSPGKVGINEAEPVRRLRAYSNFLSPVHGLSADSVSIGAIFVRNLLLHWAMVLPILCAVLLLPRMFGALLRADYGTRPWWFWAPAALCFLVAIAFASWDSSRVIVSKAQGGRATPAGPFGLLFVAPVVLGALLVVIGSLRTGNLGWVGAIGVLQAATLGALVQLYAEVAGTLFARARHPRDFATPSHLSDPWRHLVWRSMLTGAVTGAMLSIALSGLHVFVSDPDYRTTFALPIVLAALGVGSIARAGLSMRFDGSENIREWWSRASGAVAVIALAWVALSLIVVHVPIWLFRWAATWSVWSAGVASAGGVVLALITTTVGYWSEHGSDIKEKAANISQRIGLGLMDAAALVSVLVIALLASLLLGLAMTRPWFSGDPSPKADADAMRKAEACLALSKIYAAKPDGKALAERDCALVAGSAAPAKETKAPATEAGKSPGTASGPACAVKSSCAEPAGFVIDWLVQHRLSLLATGTLAIAGFLLALIAVSVFCSALFGANAFSLNSFYGNRLTRAYLGASVPRDEKRPHPFTGFDDSDNIPLRDLVNADAEGKVRLLPVVNTALNLVCPSGDRLEWQERKAASFFMTPFFCGSDVLGYVPTHAYANTRRDDSTRGVSAGRAMSISGAAVSPSMGFHSSPLVTLLLAFFNVRLGWWMPNPRSGPSVWQRDEPPLGIGPIVSELTSRAGANTDYVYLSDGGHFENLGLYEMVRRRCRHIVVVDAGCDPDYLYEDLENAVRKIRVDFGIRVTFGELLRPPGARRTGRHWFSGTVHYRECQAARDDGEIIFIKPVLSGDEPVDVRRYAESTRSNGRVFPQQPTSDQFFDEAQFESYRQLGLHSVEETFHGGPRNWPDAPDDDDGTVGATGAQPEAEALPGWAPERPSATGSLLSGLGSLGSLGQAAMFATVTAALTVTGTVALKDATVKLDQQSLAISNPNVTLEAPKDGLAVKLTGLEQMPALKVSMEPDAKVSVVSPIGVNVVIDEKKLYDVLSKFGAEFRGELEKLKLSVQLVEQSGPNDQAGKLLEILTRAEQASKDLGSASGNLAKSTEEFQKNLGIVIDELHKLLTQLGHPETGLSKRIGEIVEKLDDIHTQVGRISPRETIRGG